MAVQDVDVNVAHVLTLYWRKYHQHATLKKQNSKFTETVLVPQKMSHIYCIVNNIMNGV